MLSLQCEPVSLTTPDSDDYDTALLQNTGRFDAGNMAQAVCLGFPRIRDDGLVEADEDFTVELSSDGFADVSTTSASLEVTIEDNDGGLDDNDYNN